MTQATIERKKADPGGASPTQSEPSDGKADASPPREDEPPKNPGRKRIILIVLLVLLVIGAVLGFLYWLHARQFETTDDAFIDGHVIPMSPQVAARVARVLVDDNQFVHKGDLLVELEPIDYKVAIDQAAATEAAKKGELEQAQSQINAAIATRDEARAEVDVAQTNFENADRDLKRYEALDVRARSKQQYDNAVAAQKSTFAQVQQAKAKLASAETQIKTAQAAVITAQGNLAKAAADVSQARVNLGYTHIVAPEDGRITRKSVEPGSYVTAGQDLLALVSPDVWVVANYKETQLDLMHPGQSVTMTVDAYPGVDFTGKVNSIQAGTGSRFSLLPAENATGNFVKVVQRVPVKILFDGGASQDRLLAPGMSVEPKVRVR